MPARTALTLFHIRGIRIGVDYSWFIVLFLVIIWLSGFYRAVLGASDDAVEPYLLAVTSALLFFSSILLHELGHALVALRRGIGISEITLWLFGGVARMTRDSDSPGTEFKVAVAGPLVTLAIAVACIGIGIGAAGGDEFSRAMVVDGDTDTSGILALLAWLGTINALILVFNLIPAFPLDGGRIARAIVWKLSGNRNRATQFAGVLGQVFAYLFIAAGIFWALGVGNVIGGIWLALIGFILVQSARGHVIQAQLGRRIEGISVADVMDPDPVAIPDSASVERALDEYFLRYRWPWFPVVDAGQRFLGLIVRDAADSVPEPVRASQRVADLIERDNEQGNLRVLADAPLETLLGNDVLRRFGALAAVDPDGRLRGMITADEVGRALRGALEGDRTYPTPSP
ncbi:MAG TPA: site-2 protease family protein [Solirubrobacterales bacterium]|nr:site-2 protease family protein [Solirubrobacterales bacterium]